MNTWMLLCIGLLYLWAAIESMTHGKVGLGLAFLCYAVSNYGMYLAVKGV